MKLAITASPAVGPLAPIVLRGDAPSYFALAAELGYDGVEIHIRQPGDIDRVEVRKLMARYNLAVPTIGTGMAAGMDGLTFADPDAAIRQRAVARVAEHIALAAELGAMVTIGLVWGRMTNDPAQRPARFDAALDCLEKCCSIAEARGVTLLLEAINRYESDYPTTLGQAMQIIAGLHAPNLLLLADTYHMNIEETDLHEPLRQVAAHLGHVHLCDNNRQAPGHGHMDLAAVVKTLAAAGYGGFLSFEVQALPTPRQAAEDAIRTVRAYSAS